MIKILNTHPKTVLFCLGCLSALAMAPVYAWPLMALGYATLLTFLLKSNTQKTAALYGFVFFFGYFLSGFYWVSNSLFVDFETWWWALPFAFAGLPLLLALFPTFFIFLASFSPKLRAISFIFVLIIADFVRGYILTGFPWNFPAHIWSNNDIFMKLLPFIGLYGLNIVTITVFCSLFLIPRAIASIMLGLLIISSFWQASQSIGSELKNITLIQANIPQHEKWDPQLVERNLNRYIEMSRDALANKTEPQILIWPETAISRNVLSYPRFQQKFKDFLGSLPDESHLITGYLDIKGDDLFNSLIVMNKGGEIIASYDKHHLVPFGEYMPFGLDTITGFKGFSAGDEPSPITIGKTSFLPLICYEVIFPQYSARANGSDFILNITNDAWFGHTAGPYQHFDHARFRAAETQTPLIRLSGNGVSGLIDTKGQVVQNSRLNEQKSISLP